VSRFTPLVAFAVGVAIAFARLPLMPALKDQAPFLLAAPSMIAAAFLGGFWPTLAVSVVGLWPGVYAMTSQGGPPPKPGALVIYMAFGVVFALAGEMRQRGLKRAKKDAERLADMQQRLVQVARLNAMGEMAGALAHELNQPLTAIASYAGAAQMLAQQDNADRGQLGEILGAVSSQAVRAREIIGRIRSRVSGGELRTEPQALAGLCEEAVTVALAGRKDPDLVIRYQFDDRADQVLADRVQLQQVLVNLVRNAAEAMREAPHRRLRIGSAPASGGLLELHVADSGPGIAPDLAERLFEPFVSDKADGMGIGLAVSRSIVEAHGGRIWVETAPEGGALFRLTLPRAAKEAVA
jgi:two-component system sensor kinase FixL